MADPRASYPSFNKPIQGRIFSWWTDLLYSAVFTVQSFLDNSNGPPSCQQTGYQCSLTCSYQSLYIFFLDIISQPSIYQSISFQLVLWLFCDNFFLFMAKSGCEAGNPSPLALLIYSQVYTPMFDLLKLLLFTVPSYQDNEWVGQSTSHTVWH